MSIIHQRLHTDRRTERKRCWLFGLLLQGVCVCCYVTPCAASHLAVLPAWFSSVQCAGIVLICRVCWQGHLAPIASVDEVDLIMSRLLEDTKTASATHNILGYRVLDQSSGRVVQVLCLSCSCRCAGVRLGSSVHSDHLCSLTLGVQGTGAGTAQLGCQVRMASECTHKHPCGMTAMTNLWLHGI